jgi:hypothetical protein
MTKMKDFTGEKVGLLMVESFCQWRYPNPNSTSRVATYNCVCDCVKRIVKSVNYFRSKNGINKSCGCIRFDNAIRSAKSRAKPLGQAYLNHLMRVVLSGAEKRNLSFKLSSDEFKSLVIQNCHYCGDFPSRISPHHNPEHSFRVNGIDRVNSSIGYEKGNVVACCRTCNVMKSDLSIEEFMIHVSKIFHHPAIKAPVAV